MTEQAPERGRAHAALSRRDFLTKAGAAMGAAAAAAAMPGAAYAVQEGAIGDWAADGSKDAAVPDSAATNASWSDGTYREHNGAAFPADDASPIPPRAIPASWDYECDICVVGAGGGGLNAAARAAEQGARTICVEAMGLHGGNAQEAGMCAILGGSKLQESKRFAFPSYPFDARKLADWAIDEYHYAADPHLIYRIAEAGGTCIDWMGDCGVRWRLGEVPVYVAPKNSTLDHHVLKMKDATDAMFSFGQKHGVQYLFQSPAEALVQDGDGRIVGVVVREGYGEEKYIHAERAVILTAGGFCNNKALLQRYIPTAAMGCASSYLTAGETGECFRMGLGVNADVSGFNSSASFDGGVDWEAEGGQWARFLYDGMTQLSRQPWFTVDRCGNRLRYMDSRVGEDGANAIYALGDLATIQMTPPGHRSYIVFDAHYEDHLAGFAQEHCRKLITPDLEQIDKVPEHYRDWHHGVEDAIEADVLKKRDTLEELERDLGFAPGVLVEAVERWNEACERGEDDYMYPMPPEWLHAIKDPPFFGCRIGGNLYGTKAGLMINDEMQVISTKGTVIPGLYAGWHTAGGACGENSYIGDPILGSLLGDVSLAFCGGYLCGTYAVANEMKGGE
ncbi:FAD-dependent oxidoreductase [Eggerthella timonensis]|uniref:FAD-dependent oxidoreductase n=1 Tax=Eggerthella timonensis TaxID=1871008 RepID=UPI000C790F18|nr:FAD-dependent oxidoreductase [Eggerthella timonensis]